jgi:hypothetical protein
MSQGNLGDTRRGKPSNGGSRSKMDKKMAGQDKVMNGDLCCFLKKTASIILPLNNLTSMYNFKSSNLSVADLKYIYQQFVDAEKKIMLAEIEYLEESKKSQNLGAMKNIFDTYISMLYIAINHHPFKEMMIEECKVYDNEFLKESIKKYRTSQQDSTKHKNPEYSKSEALVFQEFRKQATRYEPITTSVPMQSIFYTRIKNALKERIEVQEAYEANTEEVKEPDFVEASKYPEPYIQIPINLEGIDFRIVSMWTKMSDSEYVSTTTKTIKTSTGQEIEIKATCRQFKDGLQFHKLFNKDHFCIVEFIEANETSAQPEETSLGIIPMCIIKKNS